MTDTPTTWMPSKDARGYTTVVSDQDPSRLINPEMKERNMSGNPWAKDLPITPAPAETGDPWPEFSEAETPWPDVAGGLPQDAEDQNIHAELETLPGGDNVTDAASWSDILQNTNLIAASVEDIRNTPISEIMPIHADDRLRITLSRPRTPNLHPLLDFDIPSIQAYYPHVRAWLGSGDYARQCVNQIPAGATVAMDVETRGLGADGFTVKCYTAAWETSEGTMSVILDPVRRADDAEVVRQIVNRAGEMVWHNAPFDIPIMYQNNLLELDAIDRVVDTQVYARMAFTDKSFSVGLENLAEVLAQFPPAELTMAAGPFKANGWAAADGWRLADINQPVYRLGAMADTIATLRLLTPIQAKTWSTLVEGHPFADMGVDDVQALALMEREQRVNRIMMRRSAVGLQVDREYLASYEEAHARELTAAKDEVVRAGLDPDAGNLGFLLVTEIDKRGELPGNWPRTDGGRLRATKDDLPMLDHPLAASVRKVDEMTKVQGYLTKVDNMVKVTGRVHPQVTILGAKATGRMSYSWPELQQFPADARPIIVSDTGLTSVDWSQIEPVVMANCAKDAEFLAPFEAGEDLYGPIQAAAGVPRKVAKVLLLAAMYGQGVASMARDLSKPKALNRPVTVEEATKWRNGMFQAMPTTRKFIDQLRYIGEQHGKIVTAEGRILTVPTDLKTKQRLAYKAVNYFCQGSAYGVLADTLVRMDDAGLGDSVHLALHDELVVDTEAAEAVAEIMRTPPEFLLKWTDGKVPVFKTDTNDMGRTWLYV